MESKSHNIGKDIQTKNQIFIDNSILTDSEISQEGLIVYLALKKLQQESRGEHLITINYLHYLLYQDSNPARRIKDNIAKGLKELLTQKYICKISRYKQKDAILVNTEELFINKTDETKRYFTIVTKDELEKVLSLAKSNTIKIVKYFCVLISLMDYTEKYVNISLNELRERCNNEISVKTIIKYNEILIQNKLICIKQNNIYFNKATLRIEEIKNTYMRYQNKMTLSQINKRFINECRENINKFNKLNPTDSNKRRSITLKYKYFLKNPTKYTKEELEKLLKEVNQMNEWNIERFKDNGDKLEKYYKNPKPIESAIKKAEQIF